MKIGFVIETVSSLKIFGGLLRYMSERSLEPRIFIPYGRRVKPYDAVSRDLLLEAFVRLSAGQIGEYTVESLAADALRSGVQSVCVLNPYRNALAEVGVLSRMRMPTFGLDYFANSVYVAATQASEPSEIQASLAALSGRLVASDYWRDLEFAVQPEHRRWESCFTSIGTPLIDVFSAVDKETACAQLGLDPKRPIVSVFTPNIRDHQAYFFYGIDTIYSLRRLARMLRAYCDKRGYQLVVKSREKQWDAKPFLRVADAAIYDLPGQVYPSTSALLVSGSAVAVHFGSMMVLEAAGAGVPTVAFAPEAIDKLHGYMKALARRLVLEKVLTPTPDSLFSFRNVSRSFPIRVKYPVFAESVDDMLDSVRHAQDDFNAFNAEFSGWRPENSASERIIQHLERASKLAPSAKIAAAG